MELIFWLSLGAVLYTWLGYPIVLAVLTCFRKKAVESNSSLPLRVSVVIAAYNEEEVIARRIDNVVAQDYPNELMEIIVASDGSVDGTNEIVRCMVKRDDRIKLSEYEERRGKTYVLNAAVRTAVGDIVIFSDAESLFCEDFVRLVVKRFQRKCWMCNWSHRVQE